jgi:hypothetical protein
VSTFAAITVALKDKRFEPAFIAVLSMLVLAIFYVLISMNGVILGNDPAVHLEKAQIFLNTGKIPLANLGWTPPLYEIVLAMFISLSGATQIGQLIFLVKIVAILCDWLLVFSAYLIASKFFNKRVGVVAAVLLLMCFPIFEANQFGGYTTVLALAFMLLIFLYTPLATERLGYLVVAFFAAFGVVLSHQLAAFLAFFIMPPVLLYMLIKSKGKYLKVVAAIVVGGGAAFVLYYAAAMLPYLNYEVIRYVFFGIETYAYQIPATSPTAYLTNFGFILFLAAIGVAVAGYQLMKNKKPLLTLILMLSFFVPLFFAESYYFGFYLPFGWFIYYLMPPLVILAAVSTVFFWDKALVFYGSHRATFKKNWVRVVTVLLVVLIASMIVYRWDVVYGKIMEGSVYYSTTDVKALDAGLWLKDNYLQNSTVISTYIPGFWLQEFSGMNVVAQTDPAVQRNEIAEAVLSLSYELEHQQTLTMAYEAKGAIFDENQVSINQVWDTVWYNSGSGDFLLYTQNGTEHQLQLSTLGKQVTFIDQGNPKQIIFALSDGNVALTRTVSYSNVSYAVGTNWALTPMKSQIYNASLYLTTLFDLKYDFKVVQIPGLLDWVNPWDAPSQIRDTHIDANPESNWAVAGFSSGDLKNGYLGLYDDKNQVAFALNFTDLPNWGNIGALAQRQIDAVRFQYNLGDLAVNQTASCSYQTMTVAKSSYPTLSRDTLMGMFGLKPSLTVNSRSYVYYLVKYNVAFLVYDRNQLDTSMIHSRLLQLVYSNDRYVIFKIIN